LDKIINRNLGKPGMLLDILEEAQCIEKAQYLSQPVLEYVAQKTDLPLSRIYSVVTFYAFFSLKPRGEHSIIVCRGTACHTRGSKNLLDYLKHLLDLKDDATQEGGKVFLTTKDNQFTLMTVACFGQCALAPVVEIDGVIHVHMTESKLKTIIQKLKQKGKGK
jgi:NADH-quinone oxidoreductase subunit E